MSSTTVITDALRLSEILFSKFKQDLVLKFIVRYLYVDTQVAAMNKYLCLVFICMCDFIISTCKLIFLIFVILSYFHTLRFRTKICLGKQWRPGSDAAQCIVYPGSTTFDAQFADT